MKTIDQYPLQIKYEMPPVAVKGDRVAIDIELFGMQKKRLHRPDNGKFALLQITLDGETVYIITDEKDVAQALENVDAGVWIFHNAKFDITHLRRWAYVPQRKRLWDTMLVEQVMFSGWYDTFALNDVVRRWLHVYMPKEVRKEFEKSTELTDEQIRYGAYDVIADWHVYWKQREAIDEDDMNVYKDIELPFLWTIMSMSGVNFDTEKWTKLAEGNAASAKEIQDLYPEINLNSPAQVKKHMHSLGYKVEGTGVAIIEKLIDECDFARDLMRYRYFSKRASTYGIKFITDYVEKDGMIHSDIYQIGAETGRTSSRNPNQQNIPHDKEYRECFIKDGEGYVIIVADWGSQEPRIAAYFSDDDALIQIFKSGKKLYIEVARDALGINITKQSEEYTHIKSTILGIFYGMSAFGLSQRINVSEEDAEHMIESILDAYPGIRDYIKKQLKVKDFATSIYGRKIWINKYSYQWQRNVLNAPIQSSAADAMKIAAYQFCKAWKEDFYKDTPLKLIVHDEMVIGCKEDEKEHMMKLLNDVMVSVSEEMHEGIPAVAEITCGDSWACK